VRSSAKWIHGEPPKLRGVPYLYPSIDISMIFIATMYEDWTGICTTFPKTGHKQMLKNLRIRLKNGEGMIKIRK